MERASDGRIKAKFDEATKQEIARRWLSGEKSKDLVTEYGFTNQKAFRVYMNKNGFVKRDVKKYLTDEEKLEVRGFYIAGWTMQDIAEYFDITKQAVSSILSKAGFTYHDRPYEFRTRRQNG